VKHLKHLKHLEAENSRLRRAVSDLTLDELILQEAARGNDQAPRVAVPASSMFDASCPSPSAAPGRRSASIARRSARSRRAVMLKSG
jgi:putative transposase